MAAFVIAFINKVIASQSYELVDTYYKVKINAVQ